MGERYVHAGKVRSRFSRDRRRGRSVLPLRRVRSRPYGSGVRWLAGRGPAYATSWVVGGCEGTGVPTCCGGSGACRPPAPGPGLPGRGRPPGGGAGAPAAGGQGRRARERGGRPRGAARPPVAGLPGVGVVLCLYWWQSRCGRRAWQVTLLREVSGSRPVLIRSLGVVVGSCKDDLGEYDEPVVFNDATADGLPGVSRTALKAVFQAACLTARCSSSASLGVLYPRAEWSRF